MPDSLMSPQDVDRLQRAMERTILNRIGDMLAGAGFWACTVQSQSGNTVTLVPDDTRVGKGQIPNVPLLSLLPQTTIQVNVGSRVYLFFENGDRSKPRATLFDLSTLASLIIGDPHNAKPVGIQGSGTQGHIHQFGTLMCPNTGTGNPIAITGATASATDTLATGLSTKVSVE